MECAMLEHIPFGFEEIVETFGDPFAKDFALNLVLFKLPFTLKYLGQPVVRATAHRKAVPHFTRALQAVRERGLTEEIQNYGGIYAKRSKRGQRGFISTHAWGIAIDLEPERMVLGSTERFSPGVLACFAEAGFTYGGDFEHRRDPMHFQLCAGY
jgi:hypothetical protein